METEQAATPQQETPSVIITQVESTNNQAEPNQEAAIGSLEDGAKIESELKPETRLIPVEVQNVNLLVELRVPLTVADKFKETQSIIERLKAKFGDDSIIEELQQLICGTVEKVTISRPERIVKEQAQAQAMAQPVSVSIPQTAQDIGSYQIQSTSCPWTHQALKMLDPVSIYKVLYESQQHRNLMTQQDLTMMEAYYAWWYEQQTKQQANQQTSFIDDNLAF